MEIITRAEAKVLGRKRYFTGKSCKHGHVAQRQVADSSCRECNRISARRWDTANPDKRHAIARKWSAANREKVNAAARKWDEANPDKRAALNAAYRAAQLQATPSWLTDDQKKQIAVLYSEAARLTRETGIEHHVDHIVPLKAKRRGGKRIASGLHVPWNLRVIPASENISRGCYIE